MRKINEINKFKKLAKILDTIFKIGYWIAIAFTPILVGLTLLTNLSPKSVIQNVFINTADTSYSIFFSNFDLTVDTRAFGVDKIITSCNLIIIPTLLSLVIIIYIIIQIRAILKNVLNETPFSLDCVSHIKKLGYGVIASGLIFDVVTGVTNYFMVQLLNLEQLLMSTNYINKVTIDITPIDVSMVIIGFLILLLAAVFKYGTYLQEEYDSTL